MRERPLTIATYAAGASLAAITLVYVFGPTFFLDDDAAHTSKASRKKGVVGLFNPANDCFINSVLQALAGLPELRTYLIREVYRRQLDGPRVYLDLGPAQEEERTKQGSKRLPEWQLLGLQQGVVTQGLKDVLDALNERPIYKKTMSAGPFIRVLELAFRTRVSRSQQDAQEFLQIIAERLAEEYNAGKVARRKTDQNGPDRSGPTETPTAAAEPSLSRDSIGSGDDAERAMLQMAAAQVQREAIDGPNKDQGVFPMEGKLESQVECSHCHFKPTPSVSSFVTLTLNVPHNELATSLSACCDGLFKVEQIDDFVCDKCRLDHALEIITKQLSRSSLSSEDRATLQSDRDKIQVALQDDPEKPPKDVKLPDLSSVPRRRITRYSRISAFPQILAIHLNRSVWDPHSVSTKNMAKVSFDETLPLGGLLDRKVYRLLGVVTHKGGHHSGHYESFRRQVLHPPFSTPNSMGTEGIYSVTRPSPAPSTAPSPQLSSVSARESPISAPAESSISSGESHALSLSTSAVPSPSSASSHSQQSPSSTTTSTSSTGPRRRAPPPTSVPLDAIPTPGLPDLPSSAPEPNPSPAAGATSLRSFSTSSTAKQSLLRGGRKRKANGHERWWRISDDKVRESKTSEVLGMQREVYLMFYELLPAQAGPSE